MMPQSFFFLFLKLTRTHTHTHKNICSAQPIKMRDFAVLINYLEPKIYFVRLCYKTNYAKYQTNFVFAGG
jgi:hypothetical protein